MRTLSPLKVLVYGALLTATAKGYIGFAQQSQEQPDNIGTNLQALYSEEQSERRHGSRRLKELAQESLDNRALIIADLINMLDDPRASSDTRHANIEILGDLKATEAVDVLVRHLTDLPLQTGLSEHYFPAVQALHKIGTPAIPAVSKALVDNPDPAIRRYAAQALGTIAGKSAQPKLDRALQKEKDPDVIATIKYWLVVLQRNP